MDIKSRAILAVVFLLSLLTLKGARRLGHFIGWFALVTKGGMYKVSQKNISLCLPELSVEEQEKLIHESLIHTGCQIAETGLAWGGSKRQRDINRQCVTVCNEQILTDAIAKNKGVIIITSHFGNWEFYTSSMPSYGDVMVLYKMAKMPLLEKRVLQIRSEAGIKLVPGTREGVETYVSHYKQGKLCLIGSDQEPSEKSGVRVPFFGVEALTPKIIHSLIQTNPKGTVVFSQMKRIANGYEMRFSEPDAEIYDADVVVSATAMNKTYERCIKADGVEQYQWDYKRFKRNPEKYYQGL